MACVRSHDAEGELESVRRQMALQVKRNQLLEQRLQNLRSQQAQLNDQLDTVKAHVDDAIAKGARVLAGGMALVLLLRPSGILATGRAA